MLVFGAKRQGSGLMMEIPGEGTQKKCLFLKSLKDTFTKSDRLESFLTPRQEGNSVNVLTNAHFLGDIAPDANIEKKF